ncbi:hypothetical protein [Oceanicola sp. 502str15]|uniref:hypothetical protein n=1 Tax=Oceanicola sp. 502str15 TaxID=2696061 RepID=UPI002095DBE6|nr:hypothetical protein [Oceanicola sp. 502str15]MCO6385086.1 hypothetical protein [Oceanicola sp. 502str15]
MSPDDIARLFTRADGSYHFARWQRPIVPIVFGVEEETLAVVKGACEALVAMAGHKMAEMDHEQGANLFFFFFREWEELLAVPDLGGMIPDLEALVARLEEAEASSYRALRFEKEGAIRAGFVFVRMDAANRAQSAEALALSQMVRVMLDWGETAFAGASPLALAGGEAVLRPEIAAVIQAGYDPVMPAVAHDASHALRLAARVGAT